MASVAAPVVGGYGGYGGYGSYGAYGVSKVVSPIATLGMFMLYFMIRVSPPHTHQITQENPVVRL